MKKSLLGFLALCLFIPILANASLNQTPQPVSVGEDKTPPSYDMKAQALFDLQDLHKKMVALANAIPAEKYTWRPEAGSRSVSEVFLHVTAANHNIPTMMTGVTGDESFKAKGFETSTTDKAKIV